jgi:curved DNA-binding protein
LAPGTDFEFQFGGTGFSDFFEQLFGSTGKGRPDFGRGSEFSGSGFSKHGGNVESDIMVSLHEAFKGSVRPITLQRTRRYDRCKGSGQVNNRRCPDCQGEGQIVKTEKYQVKIPAGVREGQRLRLAGQGEAGVGQGGAGDLILRVYLEKHPDFRVEESNLYYDLDVAPWEAVLGTKVSVPTLEGRLNIKVPPGSHNGQRLRLRGQGLPVHGGGRGDLFVVLRVQVPENISENERPLWEKLARESSFRPRD